MAGGRVVDRAQHPGRAADILQGDLEEELPGVGVAGGDCRSQLLVVAVEPVMALAKIVGLEVAPVTA